MLIEFGHRLHELHGLFAFGKNPCVSVKSVAATVADGKFLIARESFLVSENLKVIFEHF